VASPFLVKDLARDVAGTPLSYGSRWLSGYVSPHDHELVARYRRAGLVILGKTNTCELGMSPTCEPVLFGATHNPWAPGRSTGGSSGGSAAAVAAGLVAAAHGNDLGGSIRFPAAWCGVFGLKPTRGRVPLGPTLGDAVSGLWNDHVITRSVRDSAAVLDAVAGPAAGDPYPAPPPPDGGFAAQVGADPARLRIALSTTPRHGQDVDPAWSGAATAAGRLLEQLGHHVDEASPDGLDDLDYDSSRDLVYGGAMAWLVEHGTRRVGRPPADGELEPLTRAYWHGARALPAGTCLLAVEALQRIARRVAAWFERYDVWLTPTLGGPPPALGELAAQLDQARPWGGPPAGPIQANPGGHP
jgi:amidase